MTLQTDVRPDSVTGGKQYPRFFFEKRGENNVFFLFFVLNICYVDFFRMYMCGLC